MVAAVSVPLVAALVSVAHWRNGRDKQVTLAPPAPERAGLAPGGDRGALPGEAGRANVCVYGIAGACEVDPKW